MAYREVTMIEITEVLRQWLAGGRRKQIARRLGLDPKTVRRYLRTAERCGLKAGMEASALTETRLAEIVTALRTTSPREYGDRWQQCVAQREVIAGYLRAGVRVSKVRRLLARKGVQIAAATLYRFATAELGVGRTAATIAVADGEPGEELYVDTGWMTMLTPDATGRRRRFRAWIFTPSVSRYRFAYPCFAETTQSAIEACEAAWAFYGGVFKVLVPDNTKAIVTTPDPLQPRLALGFIEYAQARGFVVDPARVRKPTDQARVERSVPYVRDDCFGGEVLATLEQARVRSLVWCRDEAGLRRHSRTQRRPREHCEAVEQAALLPVPTAPYDVPQWSEPKVARDHYAQVAKALYSLPTRLIGKTLRARADTQTVRFYDGPTLVKAHPRKPPGGRATDPTDFPPEKTAYALRDVAFLEREATRHGVAIGTFAHGLLDVPLPWTRMRRVHALLGLVKRYGAARGEETCQLALAADCLDVTRLQRMLALAASPAPPPGPARVIPLPSGQHLHAYPGAHGGPTMTPDMITPDLIATLRRLKLGRLLATLPERLVLARQQQMPHQDFLLLVLGDEVVRRDSLAVTLRATAAQLDPAMTLEQWDPTAKVTYDRALWNELVSLRFLAAHAHVVLVGPVGVGKTFLAHALGWLACRQGHTVLVLTADRLLKTLKHARLDHTYEQALRKFLAVDLLIVDDFGLDALDATESRDTYEILIERHRAGSMIVTSNRGPDEWLATFADPLRAQSAIDRFVNNAYDLVIDGESYRKRQKPSLDTPASPQAKEASRTKRTRRH